MSNQYKFYPSLETIHQASLQQKHKISTKTYTYILNALQTQSHTSLLSKYGTLNNHFVVTAPL